MNQQQQQQQPCDQVLTVAEINRQPTFKIYKIYAKNYNHPSDNDEDDDDRISYTLIDHAWSERILQLVGNKARLLESFSWLSTLGGGFSALGESNAKFAGKAGHLSLKQQLNLALMIGDPRLTVMCHLYYVLSQVQLDELDHAIDYCRDFVLPLYKKLPYEDTVLKNILEHIMFRIRIAKALRLASDCRFMNCLENN